MAYKASVDCLHLAGADAGLIIILDEVQATGFRFFHLCIEGHNGFRQIVEDGFEAFMEQR